VSTTADLDRVTGLVNRVQRLGNVQPGDLIQAQRWNDLVGAVLEIAQTLLAPRDEGVPPHEHPDQVKVTWLDPSLRNVIERGPLSTGEGPRTLLELDRRVTELRTDVDGLKTSLAAIQTRLLELNTRDLQRDSTFTELHRSVTAVVNRGDSTADLRKTLSDMQVNVNRAIEVGTTLRIGNEVVDMNKLDQRIRAVEDLRTRMTSAAGEILDAHAIENKISEIRNAVVTQKQLDDALRAHSTKIPDDALVSIRDSVSAVVRGDLNTSVGVIKKDILDQADAKLKGVDELVNSRVDTRLQTTLDAAIVGVRDDITKSAASTLDQALMLAKKNSGEITADAVKTLGKRIDDVQGVIPQRVSDEVGKAVQVRVTKIEETANAASANATNALQLAQSHVPLIQKVQTDAAQIALQTAKDITTLRDTTARELAKRDTEIVRVDKRVADLDEGLDTRLDKRLNPRLLEVREALNAATRKTAEDAANAAVRNASTTLRAEMKGIAHDEISVARTGISDEVVRRIGEGTVINQVRPVGRGKAPK
jgi:hypothetical protein